MVIAASDRHIQYVEFSRTATARVSVTIERTPAASRRRCWYINRDERWCTLVDGNKASSGCCHCQVLVPAPPVGYQLEIELARRMHV
jgi:hypothetical protein